MMFRYQILLIILTPVFYILTLRHFLRYHDTTFLTQRWFALKLPALQKPIWFHCASVGEVVTAKPLIELFHHHHPDQEILVTTGTITGAETCQRLLPYAQHCYLPLDYRNNIKRFLKQISPQRVIILETEIWPNLYQLCAKHNIHLDIANGRISSRSRESSSFIKKIFFKSLQHVNHIYCRTDEDATGFKAIGADSKKISIHGNLKFSAKFTDTETKRLIDRPYVIAASTRDDEEQRILEIWNKAETNDLLLVIAPRHPERKDKIISSIQPQCRQLKTRSKNDTVTAETDVYLADTFGELASFYQHAEFVIMGGTFVNKGGQNLLEPARLGKAVLFGPSMENFAAESQLLLGANAAIQVESGEEAIAQINLLIDDVKHRESLGKKAQDIIEKNSQVAEDYYRVLSKN